MARGEEGTSTGQAGRRRGPVRRTRSTSHIVSSLTMEELRSYCEILENIDLRLMDEQDESTLGGEHNAVFFTREQLATWLTRSTSHIVSSLTMEELRSYCEIPENIDLRLMDEQDESTLGGEHNTVFFTREQLAIELRFPVPALVKQFLHFTKASLALVYPNVIRILIGCSILNFLYHLDLSLVEICFAYSLILRRGGRFPSRYWTPGCSL